ncbi:serine O-acetyltransferase EpsC [Leifsonia sp. Root112D2]|uniref:serine O-acetyltransferase EpsC n=1 Tax=Leifsonia sp. Root112D2 TaxID=1736426 RepID=UPI0006F4EE33|nr:serine O-acetyltransferase EpsC [Leifsonia sp. Root112D2]KQV05242.1 serine acetyltransferase [Leifsonia sp. Root112D2]
MSVIARLREDLANARRRDPAVRSSAEVLLGYSGLHAIWAYRVAHRWWRAPGLKLAARLLSQAARAATGVEIHPGARIGRRFFIDHGMGVVIGETAIVGDDVMLYHGVTLGGKSGGRGKRHPTIGDGVVVGAGAQILGDITIGAGSVVGANAVVVHSAGPASVIVGIPGVARPRKGATGSAAVGAADTDAEAWLDPAIYI